MPTPIQLVVNRNKAAQESEVLFVSDDLAFIASTVEAATEAFNSTVTEDHETGTIFLLSTDVGYFNLMEKESNILLLPVDVESQSGMDSLLELLKADSNFTYVEHSEAPPAPVQAKNDKGSDDSDYHFDDDEKFMPEIMWGINPHGGKVS